MGLDQRARFEPVSFREPDCDRASSHEEGVPGARTEMDLSVVEAQINIKGDSVDIQRFRQVAKRDGLRLIGLLRRALDAYEREGKEAPLQFRSAR